MKNEKKIFTKEEVVDLHNYWVNKGQVKEDDNTWTDDRIKNLVEVLNLTSDALEEIAHGSFTHIGYSTQFFPDNGYVYITIRWNGHRGANNKIWYENDHVMHLNVDDMNDAEKRRKLVEEIEKAKTIWM